MCDHKENGVHVTTDNCAVWEGGMLRVETFDLNCMHVETFKIPVPTLAERTHLLEFVRLHAHHA